MTVNSTNSIAAPTTGADAATTTTRNAMLWARTPFSSRTRQEGAASNPRGSSSSWTSSDLSLRLGRDLSLTAHPIYQRGYQPLR